MSSRLSDAFYSLSAIPSAMPDLRLPSDFPLHLQEQAPTDPIAGALPFGSQTLLFEQMHFKQFEQFCWWLLGRDHVIKGCQYVGRPGIKQDGIDLFGYANNNPKRLVVFECKCHKKFTANNLNEAVKEFLNGPWSKPGTRFVLILAQPSIGQIKNAWHATKQLLHDLGIEGDLWTGIDLTEKVRLYPDIVTRFFPGADAAKFCNEWMQRVHFMEKLQLALVDDRSFVREMAKEFIGTADTNDDIANSKERITTGDDSWNIVTTWVDMTALLPGKQFYPGSAAITIRRPDLDGITITLSQKWILEHIVRSEVAPHERRYRPFIVGPHVSNDERKVFIDLQNARLQLPVDGVSELCEAFDKMGRIYADALHKLEDLWEANGYPFVDGRNKCVALCTVPEWLWNHILNFANAHIAGSGDTEWHIFDSNRHYLKLYTTKPHPRFAPGYHAFVHARSDLYGLSYGNDVVLTWTPPNSFVDYERDGRHWLSCAETLEWMRDQLLPAVGDWLATLAANKRPRWQRVTTRADALEQWSAHARLSDLRQIPFLREDYYRRVGIVETVELLQSTLGRGVPDEVYLTPVQIQALYLAIIPVFKKGKGHISYISSNLSLNNCSTHEDLVRAIQARARQNPPNLSVHEICYLLSAVLEGLTREFDTLEAGETRQLFDALRPLMAHHDIAQLLERHTRWE